MKNIFDQAPGSARGERPFSGGPIRPTQPTTNSTNKSRPNTAGKERSPKKKKGKKLSVVVSKSP